MANRQSNKPSGGEATATITVPHIDGEFIHAVLMRLSEWFVQVPEIADLLRATYKHRAPFVAQKSIETSKKLFPTPLQLAERSERVFANSMPTIYGSFVPGVRVNVEFGDEFAYDGPPEHREVSMKIAIMMHTNWHASPMLYADVLAQE